VIGEMTLVLAGSREVSSVLVVDDEEDARRSYSWLINDLDLDPRLVDAPHPPSLEAFADRIPGLADAVLCDHHLRTHNYAQFNGAELVSLLYERVPAVLCTRWEERDIDEIRPYLDRIPALLRRTDEESLRRGLESCAREFVEGRPPSRRPWRTQVHVQEVERDTVYVNLPGWTSLHMFGLRHAAFPPHVRDALTEDLRLYAEVNLGAEAPEDVYFRAWTL